MAIATAAVTAINGNQEAATVTEVRYGMRVEVTERDRNENRKRDEL